MITYNGKKHRILITNVESNLFNRFNSDDLELLINEKASDTVGKTIDIISIDITNDNNTKNYTSMSSDTYFLKIIKIIYSLEEKESF